MKFKVFFLMYVACSLTFISLSFAKEKNDNRCWMQISGNWNIVSVDGLHFLAELKHKPYKWGYSELINNNSIIGMNSIDKWDKISFDFELLDVFLPNPSFSFVFGLEEQRLFHGLKFVYDTEIKEFSGLKLIESTIVDPKKSYRVKWNFKISEIESSAVAVPFKRKHRFEIKTSRNNYYVFVNKKRVMKFSSDKPLTAGKIGFSSIHVNPLISDLKVYSGSKIVFSDDFSTDTVRRIRATGTIRKK